MSDARREIEALADLFEGGHLLATTDPAEFLRIVRAEIERLLKVMDVLKREQKFHQSIDPPCNCVLCWAIRELEDSDE